METAERIIPYGYCQCGCGQRTNIAKKTDRHAGWIKGQPLRYVRHHFRSKFDTLAEHFWSCCSTGEPDACWEWQGTRLAFGHGVFMHKGEMRLAHRVAYELQRNLIPNGLQCLHKCDNPPCCNGAHLFVGTRVDNALDMWRKGRGRGVFGKGENHPFAKLTTRNIDEIFSLRQSGLFQREIGERFGVSRSVIGRILNGDLWSNTTRRRRG